MLLRTPRAVALAAALLLTPTAALAATAPTDGAGGASMLLLLDSSRSMEDPDARGEPKIDAARAALHELVDGLDPSLSVGLRIFGGSVALDQPTEDKCADSELVVPIGTDNADELDAAVDDYAPLGETPIAHALQEAAQDLGETGNRTIVLVSDGIATCDPDPCEVAEQLTADGLDLVVHTVGLGADEQTRGQLQCIAAAGGGTYYDATDTASLTGVLTRVSNRAFRPFTVQGTPVTGATDPGRGPELTPGGQYTDTFEVPGQRKSYTVRRSAPGTGIWVGASAQPEFGSTGMADLLLETADGERCASTRIFAGTDLSTGSVMSGSVHVPAAGASPEAPDECQSAPELQLSVTTVDTYEATEGVPFELLVGELPVLADAAVPEIPSLPEWTPLEPTGTSQEIVPGTSFNDAALVTPGVSYAVDLMPGEVLFFKVPASYGQAVQMRVDSDPALMSEAQLESMGSVGRLLVNNVYTPQRGQILNLLGGDDLGELDGDRNLIVSPSRPASSATSSGQILFSNSDQSEKPFTAGEYFLTVAYAPGDPGTPTPLTLTVDVVGQAVAGPQLLEGDGGAATATPPADAGDDAAATTAPATSGVPTPAPAATTGASSGAAGMPWGWLLGGGGAVLAAGGIVLLTTRGRKRTADA